MALTDRCALLRDGRVRCWKPAPGVEQLTDAVVLSGHRESTWAIDKQGAAHCSGCSDKELKAVRALEPLDDIAAGSPLLLERRNGDIHEMGRRGMKSVPAPPQPLALMNGATFHRCARYPGNVFCWGTNASGQMGFSHGKDYGVPPERVPFLTEPKWVSGGLSHGCAVVEGGKVKCWGRDMSDTGALGSSERELFAHKYVPGIDDAVEIDSAWYATCVVRRSGRVSCWGKSDGFTHKSALNGPVDVGVEEAEHVAMTETEVCVAQRSGAVVCLGNRRTGTPAAPNGVSKALAVAAGADSSCAILPDGQLWCWGKWGRDEQIRQPQRIHDIRDATQLSMSKTQGRVYDGCVTRKSGRVTCWAGEQLHDPGLDDALFVATTHHHACAARKSGKVSCWGFPDDAAALGSKREGGHQASEVPAISDAVAVAVTGSSSCALDGKGFVRCWGENGDGLLGIGRTSPRSSMRPLPAQLHGAVALSGSFHHLCAQRNDGRVACWGYNGWREVLFMAVSTQPRPVSHPQAKGAISASTGSSCSCSLDNSGELTCWGHMRPGLRDIFPDDKRRAAVGKAARVSVGKDHGCLLMQDGGVRCWGDDSHGELGVGRGRFGVVQVLPAEG